MPRPRNSVRKRLEALREGKVLYTAKSARGLKEPGQHGKKIPAAIAQDGIAEADQLAMRLHMPVELGVRSTVAAVAAVPVVTAAPEPLMETNLDRATAYVTLLLGSNVPLKLAVVRAADAYGIDRRVLAEHLRARDAPQDDRA